MKQKKYKKYVIYISILAIISCSKPDRCILPNKYETITKKKDISIYPYFLDISDINIGTISFNDLKGYPNCNFKEVFSKEYSIISWVSFIDLDSDSTNLINHLKKYNSDEYKNSTIIDLFKQISKNKNQFYFSGFYTQNNDNKKFFDFFYILNTKNKSLYKFRIES